MVQGSSEVPETGQKVRLELEYVDKQTTTTFDPALQMPTSGTDYVTIKETNKIITVYPNNNTTVEFSKKNMSYDQIDHHLQAVDD